MGFLKVFWPVWVVVCIGVGVWARVAKRRRREGAGDVKAFEVITALGRMEPDTEVVLRWQGQEPRFPLGRIDLIFHEGKWVVEVEAELRPA